ncbi:MAG: alpha-glucan family phosphorylase [Chloroflexi bacterium]|nr:alpha-glucan family phosphorylase [Chloroflexota bacterium]
MPAVVAYFSMEVGLDTSIPTYGGGLGMLAGDSLRGGADLGIPIVGISLLHRKGYFHQHLDAQGNQTESPVEWDPKTCLEPLDTRASITIEGRQVWIRPWRFLIRSATENEVPVYLLDTALPENSPFDQTLTDYLYGGDDHYRLCQEAILGLGGVAMLRALGYNDVETYHMNEGHSALLTIALLREESARSGLPPTERQVMERVGDECVFTTHTPVPAGMDRFPMQLARQILGEETTALMTECGCLHFDTLNMIALGLFFSRYINGVSMRHGEISTNMFPSYPINSVTNGVHAATWTSEPFRRLYDSHIPEWRYDNLYLRYSINIPLDDIYQAHIEAKQELLREVERRSGVRLNPSIMTLGFARRMTTYKRADMLFSDLERLRKIAREVGPFQIIYSGKAHPRDEGGKVLIRKIFQAAAALKDTVTVVYLEEYDMNLAMHLCAGVDLWLNTPKQPEEASGTSGMKAALNGVPSLSILDGWWVEGHIEGVTGWAIGDSKQDVSITSEINSLYDKLEHVIIPMFYHQQRTYSQSMRYAIALNGSYFNAQRMMFQYLEHAYMPSH